MKKRHSIYLLVGLLFGSFMQSVFAEKSELTVTWHKGYVGSDTNTSSTNKLNTSSSGYSYTDAFTVAKAGTKISFTDDKTTIPNSGTRRYFASAAAYVFSSWKLVGSDWEIDLESPNYQGTGTNYGIISRPNTSGTVTKIQYVYITSKDNENLRLCFRSEQTGTFTPTFPVVYMETEQGPGTAQTDSALEEWIDQQKQSVNYTQLEGKCLVAFGDSYLGGFASAHYPGANYLWPALLANKYNMAFTNYGLSGSTVSFVKDKNPMFQRWNTIKESPDIIILDGGRNDYSYNVPIGTLESNDTLTFMGALNVIIQGLKEKYPNTCIICTTVWKFTGTNTNSNTSEDFAKAMKQVAEKNDVYCFYAYDSSISGVDMTSSTFRNEYCLYPNDVSHLNIEGHKLAMPYFEKFIAESYNAYRTQKKQDGSYLLKGEWKKDDFKSFFENNQNVSQIELSLTNTITAEDLSIPDTSNCLVYTANAIGLSKNEVIENKCENLELIDNQPYSIKTSFTATNASFLRNAYQDGGWETVMVPYDVTVLPEGYLFEKFVSKGDQVVTFQSVDKLEANTPYLMKYTGTDASDGKKNDINLAATSVTVAVDKGQTLLFKGTDTEISGEGKYILASDGKSFGKGTATSTIKPFHAYLEISESNGAPAYRVVHITNQTTEVSDVTVSPLRIGIADGQMLIESCEARTVAVYGIDGTLLRKVALQPGMTTVGGFAPGMYLVGGQKVCIR